MPRHGEGLFPLGKERAPFARWFFSGSSVLSFLALAPLCFLSRAPHEACGEHYSAPSTCLRAALCCCLLDSGHRLLGSFGGLTSD